MEADGPVHCPTASPHPSDGGEQALASAGFQEEMETLELEGPALNPFAEHLCAGHSVRHWGFGENSTWVQLCEISWGRGGKSNIDGCRHEKCYPIREFLVDFLKVIWTLGDTRVGYMVQKGRQ